MSMRVLGRGLLGGTGLSKAIYALMAVVALAMGPVFAITETVTSIAGSGNTDLLVWFEFDIRNGGTAGIVDLTGEGGNLENNQPLPTGAVRLTTDGDTGSKAELGVFLPPDIPAVFLLPVAELSYSYYKANVGAPAPAPSIKITLWNPPPALGGTCPALADCFGTLVFEPYVQGAGPPPTDTWTDVAIGYTTGGGGVDNVGGFWWTGGFGKPNTFGGPPYQSLEEWSGQFNADFQGAIALALSIGVGSFNLNQVGYFDNVRLGAVGLDEIIWDFELPVPCDDPAPRTQGYWHRQCLGVDAADGGIDPGRNGRGPQEPIEAGFEKVLMPAVSALLGNLVYEDQTCDGMDADQASDPCQRAIKQFTALLLNLQSGRIPASCTVDAGCGAGTIPQLVGALAALIGSGECEAAEACAAAVNEGDGNLESSPVETIAQFDSVNETPVPTAPASSGRKTISSPMAELAIDPATAGGSMDESPRFLLLPSRMQGTEKPAKTEPVMALDDDDVIRRHLSVLGNSSAPDQAVSRSQDALLTVLSGGYDAALRLEIAEALAPRLDPGLHELLRRHLEGIRDEALDSGQDDLTSRAERLLGQLDATD